jgi:hypothetical protein
MKTNNSVVLFGDSKGINGRPLGMYVIASYLRSHGIPTQTIWGWNQIPDPIFLGLCKKYLNEEVKVIGISSTMIFCPPKPNFFGLDQDQLHQRFALIKKLAPNAKIVVGGSQTSHSNLSGIEGKEYIDLFIKGQGEDVMLEYVKSVLENTTIRTTDLIPRATSDSLYPYSHFSTTPVTFTKEDCIIPTEALGIELARGCKFRCSYCSYELNGKQSGDYIKPKEVLRNEFLKNYDAHGTTYYYIVDDLINDSMEKVDMLLEVSESLPFRLQYSGFLRLDIIRRFPTMATKLLDSGLVGTFFGIETVNDKAGRAVGKGLGKERTSEALAIVNDIWKKSVSISAGFILGLPTDDDNTKHELIEWLQTPTVKNAIDTVSIWPLAIALTQGISEIDQDPAKFGYSFIDELNIAPDNARIQGGATMNWKTSTYDVNRAREDSRWVSNEFYKNYKFKSRLSFQEVPNALAQSEFPEDLLKALTTDTSDRWDNQEEWFTYLKTLTNSYRSQYIKLMLYSKK